jgi:BirA family biotin operon repressor/biotin-[acetyl-CoA-carboxylase] ligase
MNLKDFANQTIDRCGSTNDLARQLGEAGYPSGTWVSTRIQEQGRGRLGRKWESLEGNLFLSVLLRIPNKAIWTWIPMATAVAITQAIQKALPQFQIPTKIKWPNDLWIEGQKLGGILCEAVGNQTESFIVVGIGLNCAFSPEGLDQKTLSLSSFTGSKIEADLVRDFVIEELMNVVSTLEEKGTSWLIETFNARAALSPGTPISWGEGEQKQGAILGLGEAGELLVKTLSGEEQRLYAEDVKIKRRDL